MNEIILYLLKVSLGTFIFYLVYWIWLRKETFFKANRLYLIASLITSLILPFIGFRYNSYVSYTENGNIFVELNKNLQSLANTSIPSKPLDSGINGINIISYIYLAGSAIFFLRVIWQCVSLTILTKKQGIRKVNGLNIVENNRYDLPFSFFNLVFVNPNLHSETDLTNILAHEKVHIRENHWFDLLITELFTIVFWFNPFVWFFERSIKQNHEYLADEGVLAQGLSIGQYQAILINQIMGMQVIGITNNLSYSLNKKRMKMMTKMKTPKIRAFKMAWALPAAALLLLAFAEPSYESRAEKIQESKLIINQNNQSIDIQGKVLNDEGKPLSGASVVIGGTSTGTVTNEDGSFSIKMTNTNKLYISFIGYVTLMEDMESIEKAERTGSIYKPIFKMRPGVIELNVEEMLKEVPHKNEEEFIVVEKMPDYPGGMNALAKEIKDKASNLNLSGKIKVGLTVDENGKNTAIYILGEANQKIQEDLVRFFLGLKQWSPGKQRGKAVPVSYRITINQ